MKLARAETHVTNVIFATATRWLATSHGADGGSSASTWTRKSAVPASGERKHIAPSAPNSVINLLVL
jgi:hypothetical protein